MIGAHNPRSVCPDVLKESAISTRVAREGQCERGGEARVLIPVAVGARTQVATPGSTSLPQGAVGECKPSVWASVGVPWVEPVAHFGQSTDACTALLFVDRCFDSCERRWPHGLRRALVNKGSSMPEINTETVNDIEGVADWAKQNASAEVQTRVAAILARYGKRDQQEFAEQPTQWEIDWFYRGAVKELYRMALVNTATRQELWGYS